MREPRKEPFTTMTCDDIDRGAMDLVRQIREAGFNPTYFESLILSRGALKGFELLMTSGDPHPGFLTLMNKERSDLTAENFVLNSAYRDCFNEQTRQGADWRLANWRSLK